MLALTYVRVHPIEEPFSEFQWCQILDYRHIALQMYQIEVVLKQAR